MIAADEVLEVQLAMTLLLNKQLYAPMFARFGVETYEWHVLLRLAEEDGLTQVELGRRVLRDKVAISRLVADIEANGFVRRRADEGDSRVKRVFLTAKARKMMPEAHAAYVALARRAHRTLSSADRAQLRALLNQLQRGYREAIEEVR